MMDTNMAMADLAERQRQLVRRRRRGDAASHGARPLTRRHPVASTPRPALSIPFHVRFTGTFLLLEQS